MSHLDKLSLKWTNFNIIDWVWAQDVIYYECKMGQWESLIYVLHEWSPAQNFLNRREPMWCCISRSHRLTGMKLHYIRLLAGLKLVLSVTIPANNPTEHWAHLHFHTDFPHPFSGLLPSVLSFMSPHLAPFLSSFQYCLFLFFLLNPSPPSISLALSFWESDASYFPPRLKDKHREQSCLELSS